MKKKRKKISLLALLLLYILFAPEKENYALKILPAWQANLQEQNKSDNIDKSPVIPFRVEKKFGYITESGSISYIDEIFYNVTQNNNYFINYSTITDNLIINKNDGSFSSNLKTAGFPFFIDERLFIISANSKIISEWNSEGENLFTFENESELISCDANKNTLVAGFIDGTITVADKERKAEKLLIPELSRINAVYGISVSDSSDFIAMITGIDPQYMIVMKKKNNQYNRFYTYQFSENLRHSRYISFFNNDRYLCFESGKTFYCFDFFSKNLNRIELSAVITNIKYIDFLDSFAVTAKIENEKSVFYLINPACKKLYSKTISSDFSYIDNSKNRILFGSGDTIFAADFIK